jgi:DNA-binding PadR family transcriptional regulator
MKIRDLYSIPQHTYLTRQQAIWWVCFLLQSGEVYPSKIQTELAKYSKFKLSVCVLDKALKMMVAENLITYYQQPVWRGNRRKMYQVNLEYKAIVKDFANLWKDYAHTE